jgi:hypothetical protein
MPFAFRPPSLTPRFLAAAKPSAGALANYAPFFFS